MSARGPVPTAYFCALYLFLWLNFIGSSVRGTSAVDLVSISQGPRQICLYRTLPFKPISLMSAIDSDYGDLRNTLIVVACERASTGSLNLQTGLWCEDAHAKRKSPLQTNCSCSRGWRPFRRLSLVLSLHLTRT